MGNYIRRRANPWFYLLWGLTIFFLVCKVFGFGLIASWPWWAVFAPIWGPIALGAALIILGCVVMELYLLIALIVELCSIYGRR